MGDWYGTTRSNYFKVKDAVAFKSEMSNFEVTVIEKDGAFGFLSETGNGHMPNMWVDGEIDPISITTVISKHLAENSVCVIQSAGAEKHCYVTGDAIAISHTGETVSLSLSDIYAMAKNAFGDNVDITEATY